MCNNQFEVIYEYLQLIVIANRPFLAYLQYSENKYNQYYKNIIYNYYLMYNIFFIFIGHNNNNTKYYA